MFAFEYKLAVAVGLHLYITAGFKRQPGERQQRLLVGGKQIADGRVFFVMLPQVVQIAHLE
ncbi:hypothetical protein D3C76_1829840 [compost metagenome]